MMTFKQWVQLREENAPEKKPEVQPTAPAKKYDYCDYCGRKYDAEFISGHRGLKVCDFCREKGE